MSRYSCAYIVMEGQDRQVMRMKVVSCIKSQFVPYWVDRAVDKSADQHKESVGKAQGLLTSCLNGWKMGQLGQSRTRGWSLTTCQVG